MIETGQDSEMNALASIWMINQDSINLYHLQKQLAMLA